MRNNRFALHLASAALFAAAWLALSATTRAQAPAPPAAPPAAAPAVDEPPTEAERLIDEAAKKVAAIESVSADLVQDVKMLGQSFQIQGRYLKAPPSRVYLKLTVTGLPGSTGTMLQVCDGEVLWDYQQILESQVYRRLNVKPVFERLQAPEIDDKLRDDILTSLGFSGPETLLVGLRKSVKFDQKEEGELDGRPVYILRGSWKNREGIVGPDQRPIPATGMLPPYIPSLAILYIGKEDGWPYKLDLQGRQITNLVDTRQVGPDGKKIGKLSSIERPEPAAIHLVYSNVQFGVSIRPEEFAFQAPANATIEDNTEIVLKGLNQAIEYQAMQKRAEAAARDGATLNQSIEIPKTPSAIELPK